MSTCLKYPEVERCHFHLKVERSLCLKHLNVERSLLNVERSQFNVERSQFKVERFPTTRRILSYAV